MIFKRNQNAVKLAFAVATVLIMTLIVLLVNTSAKQTVAKDLSQIDYFQDFSLDVWETEETFTQDDLKEQTVTIVNGWAPWCSGCVTEMPDLEELSQEYADKGLKIIGVVVDYSSTSRSDSGYDTKIQDVLDRTGVTYPVLKADTLFEQEVVPAAHSAFPCTWAVNADGEIIAQVNGAKSNASWKALFDEWLQMEAGGK